MTTTLYKSIVDKVLLLLKCNNTTTLYYLLLQQFSNTFTTVYSFGVK
jgi:hypothetical protein